MHCRWGMGLVTITAFALGLLSPLVNAAQAQSKGQQPPAQQESAPAPVPPGPYKAVAITLPERSSDKSLEAFRKQLAEIAGRKDRAALAKLIHKRFFWERQSGSGVNPKRSPMANFAAAIGLDDKEDPDAGWEMLAVYAEDPTTFALTDRAGVVCGPADPNFEEDAFQALLDSTKTDISDWVYPVTSGVELRAEPRPDAPVSEKIGLTFIRVIGSDKPPENQAAANFLNVMLPSGKSGFARVEDIASLSIGQICYVKDGNAWRITGVLGGME